MKTVILAAGRSKRFADAGFPKPKLLLPMPDGGTLLEKQIELVNVPEYYLIVNERDVDILSSTVHKIVRKSIGHKFNFARIC